MMAARCCNGAQAKQVWCWCRALVQAAFRRLCHESSEEASAPQKRAWEWAAGPPRPGATAPRVAPCTSSRAPSHAARGGLGPPCPTRAAGRGLARSPCRPATARWSSACRNPKARVSAASGPPRRCRTKRPRARSSSLAASIAQRRFRVRPSAPKCPPTTKIALAGRPRVPAAGVCPSIGAAHTRTVRLVPATASGGAWTFLASSTGRSAVVAPASSMRMSGMEGRSRRRRCCSSTAPAAHGTRAPEHAPCSFRVTRAFSSQAACRWP
mmetsp:Transcript_45271/g.129257  ORF Transcript_45271/g.129257 Transcript_45271/m.129257 type:complete len:268 (+) Transcript_45271:166-969(+)